MNLDAMSHRTSGLIFAHAVTSIPMVIGLLQQRATFNRILDIFLPSSSTGRAPVHIFNHGGFRYQFGSHEWSFVVAPLTAAGAIGSAKAFSRRITESCFNGTIIVIIMKLSNALSCIKITTSSGVF
jgi:hypothetical protein